MSERTFPILLPSWRMDDQIRAIRNAGGCIMVVAIPWVMIAPHDAQAKCNHSQSLERLAERGGLSACEALAVLEDRDYSSMSVAQANIGLSMCLADFRREAAETSPASAHTDSNASPAPADQGVGARYPRNSQGGTR